MSDKKKARKTKQVSEKVEKETPVESEVKGWKAPRPEYPSVLIGLDPDGWHGLRIGSAYCGWTHVSDRNEVLRGVLEVVDTAVKDARGRAKDLEKLLQDALRRIEQLELLSKVRTKRPRAANKA